jgi:hypothetical protein
MGGAPRIIKKVIETPKKIVSNVVGGGSPETSPITERREEVAKKTEPAEKKVAPRKLKRRSRKRSRSLVGSVVPRPGLETTSDYSPIRNPRDTGSKLGSA